MDALRDVESKMFMGKNAMLESVFHPKLLQEEWFQELIAVQEENLKYEQRFLFFNQICLKNGAAPDEPMEKAKFYVEPTKESLNAKVFSGKSMRDVIEKVI